MSDRPKSLKEAFHAAAAAGERPRMSFRGVDGYTYVVYLDEEIPPHIRRIMPPNILATVEGQ